MIVQSFSLTRLFFELIDADVLHFEQCHNDSTTKMTHKKTICIVFISNESFSHFPCVKRHTFKSTYATRWLIRFQSNHWMNVSWISACRTEFEQLARFCVCFSFRPKKKQTFFNNSNRFLPLTYEFFRRL